MKIITLIKRYFSSESFCSGINCCRMCELLLIILSTSCSLRSVNSVECATVAVPQLPASVEVEKRTHAVQTPDLAGVAYVSLASTVARNRSCKDCCGRSRALNTRSAYSNVVTGRQLIIDKGLIIDNADLITCAEFTDLWFLPRCM